MADPLSIAASIAGLIALASAITSGIYKLATDSDESGERLLTEVASLEIILRRTHTVINDLAKDEEAAEFENLDDVRVEDLVTIITGCVCTFSSLQALLVKKQLHERGKPTDFLDDVPNSFRPSKHRRSLSYSLSRSSKLLKKASMQRLSNFRGPRLDSLLVDLSRHKLSLQLMLTLIQSSNQTRTLATLEAFRQSIEEISAHVRLMKSYQPSLSTVPDEPLACNDTKSISEGSIYGYNNVLRQTRVYRNPRLWDPETRSIFTTDKGGTTWTALSEFTLADIASMICVISLPLPGERLFKLDRIIEENIYNLGISPGDIQVTPTRNTIPSTQISSHRLTSPSSTSYDAADIPAHEKDEAEEKENAKEHDQKGIVEEKVQTGQSEESIPKSFFGTAILKSIPVTTKEIVMEPASIATLVSLHYAIQLGNLSTIHALLKPKPPFKRHNILNEPVEGTFKGFTGKSETFHLPLQYAVHQAQPVMAKALLEYGADPFATPPHKLVSILELVAGPYEPSMLRVFLGHGAELERTQQGALSRMMNILLPLAVSRNCYKTVHILLDYWPLIPADVWTNMTDHPKITLDWCLREAAKNQSTAVISELLKRGADANLSETDMTRSLLAEAVYLNNVHLVDLLLSFGARPNLYRPNWKPIMFWAFHNYLNTPNFIIIERLLNNGAHLNIPFHLTPRHHLSILQLAYRTVSPKNHSGALRMLLQYDPNINATDTFKNTILHTVCNSDEPNNALIEMLVQRGADVNAINSSGQTPLHLFCAKHYFCEQHNTTPHLHIEWQSCITTLLKAGADETIKDVNAFTPFDLMMPVSKCLQDSKEMVMRLRNAKEKITWEYEIPEPLPKLMIGEETKILDLSALIDGRASIEILPSGPSSSPIVAV